VPPARDAAGALVTFIDFLSEILVGRRLGAASQTTFLTKRHVAHPKDV
jgi:hypothetical protein